MDLLSSTLLLQVTLCAYVAGVVGSLLALRRERVANLVGFGCATVAAVSGMGAALLALTVEAASGPVTFELWPSLIPYLQLRVRLDPLGAFFLLILSVVGLALSLYSFGYVRGFYGRKNVGVLAQLRAAESAEAILAVLGSIRLRQG